MKLKYTFEIMEMDNQKVAVPVGDHANDFHGIIKLNDSAYVVFDMLSEDTTEERIVDQLSKDYENPKEEIRSFVCAYINALKADGIVVE